MSLAIKSEHSTMSVEWDYVEVLVEEISKRIKRKEIEFDNIIGLSRGGLVPGVMLSHALGVNFIPLVWQTRDGDKKDRELLSKYNSSKTLIVDDLVDSGETFFQVKETSPNVQYCALFNKQPSIALDFWGSTLYNESRWLDFPWELQ